MQAKMCASVWMEGSTARVILAAAVHQGLGEHFVNTTIILVSSSVPLQAHLRHTYSHTVLFCRYNCQPCESSYIHSFILNFSTPSCSPYIWTGCSCLNDGYYNASHCLCQEGYGGPYCEAFVGEGEFLSCCPLHVGGVCICTCLCACACTYGVHVCIWTKTLQCLGYLSICSDCSCNHRGNCITTVDASGQWAFSCNCNYGYTGSNCQYEQGVLMLHTHAHWDTHAVYNICTVPTKCYTHIEIHMLQYHMHGCTWLTSRNWMGIWFITLRHLIIHIRWLHVTKFEVSI